MDYNHCKKSVFAADEGAQESGMYIAGRLGTCYPGSDMLTMEDRSILVTCMEQLSDEERQIVMLHAAVGFKHREIARIMELPLSTVLSKYARALKRLKQYLQ